MPRYPRARQWADELPATTPAIGITSSTFTPARLSRVIGRHGKTVGAEWLNVSTWGHIATAIGRRFIRDAAITSRGLYGDLDRDDDEEASDQEEDGEKDTIINLQTGHSVWTSGLVYGRQVGEGNWETMQRRESFRILSDEWHRLLGLSSAGTLQTVAAGPGLKRKAASLDLEHFQQLRRVDLLLELQRLLGPNARFSPGQKPIFDTIIQNKSPTLAILPTRGGKSLLFQQPAASGQHHVRCHRRHRPARIAAGEPLGPLCRSEDSCRTLGS